MTCPKTLVEQDFDLEKYLGNWYELHRSKGQTGETGECATQNITTRSDGLLGIENAESPVEANGTFGARTGIQAKAKQNNPANHEARLGLKFSNWQPVWFAYDVLYTDYENIAIVYSCFSLGVWKMEQ